MNRPQYILTANSDFTAFEFKSNGARGIIDKAVKFSETNHPDIFNLAFGDVSKIDDGIYQVDDTAVSGDRDMVLNTVAIAIYEFTEKNPGVYVIFMGSTASRTRLYKRAISLNYGEISKTFYTFGLVEMEGGMLERIDFDPHIDCTAYLVKRK